MRRFAPGLVLLALSAACGSEPAAPPAPPAAHAAPAATAATVLALGALAVPAAGHATVALPARATGVATAGHDPTPRSWSAHFGKGGDAAQIQLGDRDAAEHATITFYGSTLAVGPRDLSPATDETVTAHAGHDDSVYTVALSLPGHDLRSVSGTIELTEVTADRVAGTIDVVVKERDGVAPLAPSALVRFDAARDPYIESWIENESAVRAQLRARHHR